MRVVFCCFKGTQCFAIFEGMNYLKSIILIFIFSYPYRVCCQDTILISTNKLDSKLGCFNSKNNGLIATKEEFKSNVFLSTNSSPKCKTYDLPDFDFSSNNLIWFDLSIGNSFPKETETYLYKISSQKKYFF